jgi:hypothetical protein
VGPETVEVADETGAGDEGPLLDTVLVTAAGALAAEALTAEAA